MRITNKMMTNNALYNINTNKNSMSKLEQIYSTGKKIQRPSEDPIIAVRALKLRTNLSEINQYYEKNIPDAKSWMDVTESALNNVNDIIKQMNTYCVQGSNDTLTKDDRNSIVTNLTQLKKQVYAEGNAQYAGRYVFTGYKTDTSLVFNQNETNYNYEIEESLTGTGIERIKKAMNSHDLSDYDPANPGNSNFDTKPNVMDAYRLQLAYRNLKTEDDGGKIEISYPVLDSNGDYELDGDGKVVYDTFNGNIVSVKSTDGDAYQPGPGEIQYIADTGELIFADDVYEDFKNLPEIKVSYEKNSFTEGELRPENYFNCTVTDLSDPDKEPIVYTKSNQEITYEVNFNQKLKINTQGSDAITHAIGRCIDDILDSINAVAAVEDKIAETEKMLENGSNTTEQTAALNELLEMLNTELTSKSEVMQTSFEKGITKLSEQQNIVNVAVADLGSRYVRLELTESRLSEEQVDFEELLSSNEDADVVEAFVKLTSQQTIYNASLSAAAKIVQNSLLDFL